MMELVRRCGRCPGHMGKVCRHDCPPGMGDVDVDQRYQDGPFKGRCISDDVWSLEQLEELGAARRHWARVRDDEADVTVDLGAGPVDFG